jgi:pilus assembly protein Flp/PilA
MLFAPKEKGQGLVEYAIILALIAIVVIAVMTTLGKKVNNTFNSIGDSLTVFSDSIRSRRVCLRVLCRRLARRDCSARPSLSITVQRTRPFLDRAEDEC